MRVEYINPFIESVTSIFGKMLRAEVQRSALGLVEDGTAPMEITALIGLSGDVCGTVALAMPTSTALAVVNRLLGTESAVVDANVFDGVAELVNMIAGAAKTKFSGGGTPLDLSLPTIVRGVSYAVQYPSGTDWLEISFNSDLGPFSLRVTLADRPPPA